jgi:outer membrane protein
MQIHKALVLFGLAAILVWGTAAQDEPIRIGIVDIDQAISSTDEGKAAREEFGRKQREAQAKLEPMIERYQQQEDDLKAKKFVLSDEALFQKQVEMAELKNKIDNKFSELEGQLKIEQGKMIAPLRAKLVEIIENIGKEQGFTLIIGRDTPGVMYTREALDITDQVIELFNQQS